MPKIQVTGFNISHFCRTEVFLIFAPTRQLDRAMGHTVQGLVLLQHQDRFFLHNCWLVAKKSSFPATSTWIKPPELAHVAFKSQGSVRRAASSKGSAKGLSPMQMFLSDSSHCPVLSVSESVTFCSFLNFAPILGFVKVVRWISLICEMELSKLIN